MRSSVRRCGSAITGIMPYLVVPSVHGECLHVRRHEPTLPAARYGYGLAFDTGRGVSVLFGGEVEYSHSGTTIFGDTWEWDGTHWRQRVVQGPSARAGAVLVHDAARNETVLFGGRDDGAYLGDTWIWDGEQWTLKNVPGPPARADHGAVYDSARGLVVLFGGTAGTPLGDTWEWNGEAWTQRSETGPTPRAHFGLAYDESRHVTVLFGGWDTKFESDEFGDTWEWNGTSWAQVGKDLDLARAHHGMTYDSARNLTVMNGGFGAGWSPCATAVWDGKTWLCREAVTPLRRSGHAIVFDSTRDVAVLFSGDRWRPDTWEWDGAEWSHRHGRPPIGQGQAMAYDSVRGVAVLFLIEWKETWEWDGIYWRQPNGVDPGPGNDLDFAMAFDPSRGLTIAYSGDDELWGWAGQFWRPVANSGGLPLLRPATMAFDNGRGVLVLHSGVNTFSQTWEWDGKAWTRRSWIIDIPPSGPIGAWSSIAYDEHRGVCVLFGGNTDFQFLGETWEWGGATWTLRATDGPSPRARHQMVYDPDRRTTLLFGGEGDTGDLHDWWQWDGETWTLLGTSAISGRYHHAMAYDESSDSIMLFGGAQHDERDNLYLLNDTWQATIQQPDADDDGKSDLADFSIAQSCLGQLAEEGSCAVFDTDGSGTIELRDFGHCFAGMSGPVAP